MRGILLAGGTGSRMRPLTFSIPKQLLPVHRQPLISYSLSTLMLTGVKDMAIICEQRYEDNFSRLFGNGASLGINISYVHQNEPNGIAEALLLSEGFIDDAKHIGVALGDNIFHGFGMGRGLLNNWSGDGALIFAKKVVNPQDYGVVELDQDGAVLRLLEKPLDTKSNLAIPGLYFYEKNVLEIAKELRPTVPKGVEFGITEINSAYAALEKLKVVSLDRSTFWVDAGTHDSLADATEYVRSIETRHATRVGCPEEVAWRMGYIDDNQLAKLAEPLMKSGYGQYLLGLLEQGK